MHKRLFSRKNPWKTSFFMIAFALFLFVAISGAITFIWPTTHFFIQFNVLFHTGVGILAGVLMGYFFLCHWLSHRDRKNKRNISKSYRWIGHIAGVSILISFFTGILLIFIGTSGQATLFYWFHIVVSLVGFGALGYHLEKSLTRRRAKARQPTHQPIRKGLPVSVFGGATLLAISAVLGFTYSPSTANTIEPSQYSYPYGADPFAPSQVTTPNSAFINENIMVDSQSCGQANCHTDVYEQWEQSAHRYSADNPWFERALARMVETEGNHARCCWLRIHQICRFLRMQVTA